MIVLNVRNVQEALPYALQLLHNEGQERDSRYGKVLVVDEPVATVYSHPRERVIFHPWRDANPFFHFYESLWMLAGRSDVAPLAYYAKRMATFSDDGKSYNAAYGRRWRRARAGDPHETVDQLPHIARLLEKNSNERRAVLQIWDHAYDLGYAGKDAACNTMATFQVNQKGEVDMTVFCRSNDIVWGCYGANAVHFSMLHEYIAARANYRVGTYTQISVNWHGYLETVGPLMEFKTPHLDEIEAPYEMTPFQPYPLSDGKLDDTWDDDVRNFVTNDGRLPKVNHFKNRFFADVAWPIVQAHQIYKDYTNLGEARFHDAIDALTRCEAEDWATACRQWLERRLAKFKRAADDGVHGVTP